MKQKSKMIKLVGFAVTIIGVGVNLVSDWLDEQKMDEKIEEKINEALVQKNKRDIRRRRTSKNHRCHCG